MVPLLPLEAPEVEDAPEPEEVEDALVVDAPVLVAPDTPRDARAMPLLIVLVVTQLLEEGVDAGAEGVTVSPERHINVSVRFLNELIYEEY